MEKEYIYGQQDTTKVRLPLKNLPDLQEQESEGLRVKRVAPVSIEPLPRRDTVEQQTGTAGQLPAVPSAATRRVFRQWQPEKYFLVGDSIYIAPREEVQLATGKDSSGKGLVLPFHRKAAVNTDWITLLLLFSLVLFAAVRNIWKKYVGNLFQSAFNYSTANRMFREKNYSVIHGAFWLDVFSFVVFPLFIYQVFNNFNVHFSVQGVRLFFFIVGAVLVYLLVKKMMYRFIGFLFENTSETGEFLFNMNNFNRVGTMVLLPIVVVLAFVPFRNSMIPVSIGIGMVGLIYFLLLTRGFVILLKKQFSLIYLFLYFCTLEILPLVLIYKILLLEVGIV